MALNETHLNAQTQEFKLPGYLQVSRRDRSRTKGDTRKGGGIALFVREDFCDCIVELEHSPTYERTWFLIFSDHGPLLFANWYRPPAPNEVDSINSFKLELTKLSENTIGSILVGDLNVHHVQWLYH